MEPLTLQQVISSYKEPLAEVSEPPLWLDKDRYRRGRAFVRKYQAGLTVAHTFSAFHIALFPTVFNILVYFAKYETLSGAMQLFIGLLANLFTWYEGDLWDPTTLASSSMKRVHRLHSRLALVANKFKDRVDTTEMNTTREPTVPSQCIFSAPLLDMAGTVSSFTNHAIVPNDKPHMTQLDFILMSLSLVYPVYACPEKVGIHGMTSKELGDYTHMMRVIVYYMGIEDSYNPFRASPEEVGAISKEYVQYSIIPHIKAVNYDQDYFFRVAFTSGNTISPFFRVFSLVPQSFAMMSTWIADVPEATDVLIKNSPWYATLYFWLIRNLLYVGMRVKAVTVVINFVADYLVRHVLMLNEQGVKHRRVKK